MAAVRSVHTGFRDAVADKERGKTRLTPVSQEKAFLDHVLRIGGDRAGRLALHVHLSRLGPDFRQPDCIREAIGTFKDFVVSHDAQLFSLANHDIVLMTRNAPMDAIERVLTRLRYRFRQDPLSRPGNADSDAFATWYDIERDYKVLFAFARSCNDDGEARKREAAIRVRAAKSDGSKCSPLTPRQLGHIEAVIARSDMAAMIRSQPVCGVRDDHAPEPVLDERYVSIQALQDGLMPQASLAGDPWLFRRLTGALDRQMLRLVNDGDVPERAISLNLSVATVLSSEFDQLEGMLLPRLAGKLVFELQAADYFLDPAAFAEARDRMIRAGHTLCLDGATHHTLPFMDRHHLGVDLIKLRWSDELPELVGQGENAGSGCTALTDAISRIGPARLILCRCENAKAVEVGRALGVTLFQGRHIDYLLAVQNTVSERAGRLRHAQISAVDPDRGVNDVRPPMATRRASPSESRFATADRFAGFRRTAV